MGIIEIENGGKLKIVSHIITYGNAATAEITEQMIQEIETMWNEPQAHILLNGTQFFVQFSISGAYNPNIDAEEILSNDDPRNNYFRIEEFVHGNISFVDGLGCNTGYFKVENLYKGSTTAAHEFGHTLGLNHPENIDLRGRGVPGIMYPRGTLVDPQYQYDPSQPAGVTGGTMHPMYRKVKQEDIALLRINTLHFVNNTATIGDFSSIWHPNHQNIGLA